MSAIITTAIVPVAAPAACAQDASSAMIFDPKNSLGLSTGPAASAPAAVANSFPAWDWWVKHNEEPLEIVPLARKRDLNPVRA